MFIFNKTATESNPGTKHLKESFTASSATLGLSLINGGFTILVTECSRDFAFISHKVVQNLISLFQP